MRQNEKIGQMNDKEIRVIIAAMLTRKTRHSSRRQWKGIYEGILELEVHKTILNAFFAALTNFNPCCPNSSTRGRGY